MFAQAKKAGLDIEAKAAWAEELLFGLLGGQPGPHPGLQDGDAEAEREVLVVGSGAFGPGPGRDRRAGP